MSNEVTGAEAGLSGDDQIKIILTYIKSNNGITQTKELYSALEKQLSNKKLSSQGKASLRFYLYQKFNSFQQKSLTLYKIINNMILL